MNTQSKKWEIIGKLKVKNGKAKADDIVDILLKNRGIKTVKEKKEFFSPTSPEKITLNSLGLERTSINKAIARIKKAIKNKEKIIIYGDYDADGITGTAILWECLFSLGANVMPYIPERFSEGYGLNSESITRLKQENPDLGLIITVDNGIVANKQVELAKKIGIDVVITDHHQKGKAAPKAFAIVHTTEISGAALAWVLAREIRKKLAGKSEIPKGLELTAIGVIADQMPLTGVNRSFVKYGLEALNRTKRLGLLSLFKEIGIKKGEIGIYAVGFMIAPRINAMGRLKHAIDSLRLLCTRNRKQAEELASFLGKTNAERQKIVEEVVVHARRASKNMMSESVIFIAHESYHEGVIGLAASRLVEEYYKPTIIVSRGKEISKASARSIQGFNIIKAIKSMEELLIDAGGHPMAAGFSIKTSNMEKFSLRFNKETTRLLTEELLTKKLSVDLELDFNLINKRLSDLIKKFEPTGSANPSPTFVTKSVLVVGARAVGKNRRHLKMKLRRDEQIFDAIAFGFGEYSPRLSLGEEIDLVYALEENVWNGVRSLQLNVKDMRLANKAVELC